MPANRARATRAKKLKVGYQGVPGAYSSLAVKEYFPSATARGFATFADVVSALKNGDVTYALLPIENSTSGRVADIHHLLPGSGLSIIDEHFLPIRHCLIALSGVKKRDIRDAYSHREALAQCAQYLHKNHVTPIPFGDTAGSVEYIIAENLRDAGAIASLYAAELHRKHVLVLERDIQDDPHNVTRFLVLARGSAKKNMSGDVVTSLSFETRDVPAALFKALSGFATAGVNIIKLESFIPMSRNGSAHFYLEFEGNPTNSHCAVALQECGFYAKKLEILGTYPKNLFRKTFEK